MRHDAARAMLFQMDYSIQSLSLTTGADHADLVQLIGVYQNF
ncbi:hypothetical protein [Asticcacaulis sp. W401b]